MYFVVKKRCLPVAANDLMKNDCINMKTFTVV